MKISGQLVDIHSRDIYPAKVHFAQGRITSIEKVASAPELFILPGLIDAHIHIESSMVTPGAFSCTAVRHGTTGVVSDPHEIANVLGLKGIEFMLDDARKVPMRFWFGAPSCVPATVFETSGGYLNSNDIIDLLQRDEIIYLSEMMNFPGVINGDLEVRKKLEGAKKAGKPIDGHCPGLTGEMLKKYVSAGISTDHECSSLNEALEKISLGMKILIREGSAARNLESLKELFNTNPNDIMLCSDDLHPEMLVERHINKIIADLISDGFDIFNVIRSATINPKNHYKLDAGLLRPGESADFILVNSLEKMNVIETWIEGIKVYGEGSILYSYNTGKVINNFICSPVNIGQIKIINQHKDIRVIEAFDGELTTKEVIYKPGSGEFIESSIDSDILKIIVLDRYRGSPPVAGFIKGFHLKRGALASSIAHDSHNIICIGTNDIDIVGAINQIVYQKGGLSVSIDRNITSLELNIGGIMTSDPCNEVAINYLKMNELVRSLGCPMKAPFMTLSFMALLVIPDLKIGDKGLFDVNRFELVSLFT